MTPTLPKPDPRADQGVCVRPFHFASEAGRDEYLARARGAGVPYLVLSDSPLTVVLGGSCRADDPTDTELTR